MLAALRLLRCALDRDAELVSAIRAATHSGARCQHLGRGCRKARACSTLALQSGMRPIALQLRPARRTHAQAVTADLHPVSACLSLPAPLCFAPPPKAASYETLDAVLRHDRRRIPVLLDFVRYPHNPAIQARAPPLALQWRSWLLPPAALLWLCPTGPAAARHSARLWLGGPECRSVVLRFLAGVLPFLLLRCRPRRSASRRTCQVGACWLLRNSVWSGLDSHPQLP